MITARRPRHVWRSRTSCASHATDPISILIHRCKLSIFADFVTPRLITIGQDAASICIATVYIIVNSDRFNSKYIVYI